MCEYCHDNMGTSDVHRRQVLKDRSLKVSAPSGAPPHWAFTGGDKWLTHHEMEKSPNFSRKRDVTWEAIHDKLGSGRHYGAEYAFKNPLFHVDGLMINAAAAAAASSSSRSQPPPARQRWVDMNHDDTGHW